MEFATDHLIFTPRDVDLSRSPLRRGIEVPTHVLGAFNPGLTRLPNGNLLLMVRIAEALTTPIVGNHIHAIRWDPCGRFVLDRYDLALVDASDPRKFRIRGHPSKVVALTSLSWLLPVEVTPDADAIVRVHYERAISPQASCQEYGVEDARISRIGDRYYLTACSVSAERHCTTLHTSANGLDYEFQGIILDHQNKDMVLFEGLVGGKFHALTRPLGELYLAYPPESPFESGPSINLAVSPDALHWRPVDGPLIRPRRGTASVMRVGGGTPPLATPDGWVLLYHGVQPGTIVGVYRTFRALLDPEDPRKVLHLDDVHPLLEPNPALTADLADLLYLTDVVFTTGWVDAGGHYIVASGEADLACRITHVPKHHLAPG
jgi:predicted GH43/DUF377 family glycosyl hydrolase